MIEPPRTSPAANSPGILVSMRNDPANVLGRGHLRARSGPALRPQDEAAFVEIDGLFEQIGVGLRPQAADYIPPYGAPPAKDPELLRTAKERHPHVLWTLKWASTKIKEISPQILLSYQRFLAGSGGGGQG